MCVVVLVFVTVLVWGGVVDVVYVDVVDDVVYGGVCVVDGAAGGVVGGVS